MLNLSKYLLQTDENVNRSNPKLMWLWEKTPDNGDGVRTKAKTDDEEFSFTSRSDVRLQGVSFAEPVEVSPANQRECEQNKLEFMWLREKTPDNGGGVRKAKAKA